MWDFLSTHTEVEDVASAPVSIPALGVCLTLAGPEFPEITLGDQHSSGGCGVHSSSLPFVICVCVMLSLSLPVYQVRLDWLPLTCRGVNLQNCWRQKSSARDNFGATPPNHNYIIIIIISLIS